MAGTSYTYTGANGVQMTATPNANITPAQATAVASNSSYKAVSSGGTPAASTSSSGSPAKVTTPTVTTPTVTTPTTTTSSMSVNDFIDYLGKNNILTDSSAAGVAAAKTKAASINGSSTAPVGSNPINNTVGTALGTTPVPAGMGTNDFIDMLAKQGILTNPDGTPASTETITNAKNLANGNPPKQPTPTPLTAFQQWVKDNVYGSSISDADLLTALKDPNTLANYYNTYNSSLKTAQDVQDQKDKAAADTAAQNAQFQVDEAKLGAENAKTMDDIQTMWKGSQEAEMAARYAADPYAATTTGSGTYNAINEHMSKTTAYTQTMQDFAEQALKANNQVALNKIQSDLSDYLSKSRDTLSALIADANKTAIQQQQWQSTFNQNEQIKNMTLADKELQTITEQTGSNILKLPDDTSQFNSSQMSILTGAPGYNALIQSGMKPNDALAYVKNAAVSNKQQVADQKLASQNALNALTIQQKQLSILDKQSAGLDLQTLAAVGNGEYATAFAQAGLHNVYSKQQSTTGLTNLAAIANTGDIAGLNSGLAGYVLSSNTGDADTYNGLVSIAGALQDVKQKIANVDPGLINGTMTQVAAKFGMRYVANGTGGQPEMVNDPNSKVTDPNLREIGQELTHIVPFYAKMIVGVRGAASAVGGNASSFAQLIPSIKENKDLLFSDIDAFVNTAKDLTNNAVKARITPALYDKIYGTNGVLGGSTGSTQNNTFSITAGGKNWVFPTQSALDSFKKEAGL